MRKLVSVRQLVLILIISMVTLKVLLLPSLLAKDIGRDSYIFMLFMLVLDFLVLLILLYIFNKNPDLSFYQVVKKLFGKVGAKIIMFLFFLFFLLKSWGAFQTNLSYLNENLYTSLDWYIFAFPILITVFFIASFGVNSLARLVEIVCPIIIVGFLGCFAVGLFRADFSSLMPFMEKGFFTHIPTIFRYSFWFGDYMIFIVFFGNVKEEKKATQKISICIIISILIVVFFTAIAYSLFNYNSVTHTNSISDVLQVLPSISDIGSFDWVMVLIWDCSLFLFFTLNILGAFYSFRQVFFKKHQLMCVFIILAIMLACCVAINFDIFGAINLVRDYGCYFSFAMQYVLPVILFIFSFKIKRRDVNAQATLEK